MHSLHDVIGLLRVIFFRDVRRDVVVPASFFDVRVGTATDLAITGEYKPVIGCSNALLCWLYRRKMMDKEGGF